MDYQNIGPLLTVSVAPDYLIQYLHATRPHPPPLSNKNRNKLCLITIYAKYASMQYVKYVVKTSNVQNGMFMLRLLRRP